MWKERIRKLILILLGAAIATFGIHNIHQQTHITEGGVIGMVLLANHWLGIPASAATFVLDTLRERKEYLGTGSVFQPQQFGRPFVIRRGVLEENVRQLYLQGREYL